ncbi:MAG: hypothetical protein ABIX01_12560 [Chitinophagaceae bacterium]
MTRKHLLSIFVSAAFLTALQAQNVGIRTTTPATSLHVFSGSTISNSSYGYLLLGDPASVNVAIGNKGIQARIAEYSSALFLQQLGASVHIGPPTATEPSATLFIPVGTDVGLDELHSGFVMLGTSNSANLIMDNNELMARNNGNFATLYLQNDGGGVNIGGNSNSGVVRLDVNGDAIFRGKMRVGLTSLPLGYSFGVDGKMICEEVQVKLKADWADYVFAPAYTLRPINQVADFIKQNNHLPGIPAAASIAKDGLSIGEMQKLQMEKIEELTLYIIQLNEEVAQLKKR